MAMSNLAKAYILHFALAQQVNRKPNKPSAEVLPMLKQHKTDSVLQH